MRIKSAVHFVTVERKRASVNVMIQMLKSPKININNRITKHDYFFALNKEAATTMKSFLQEMQKNSELPQAGTQAN